MPKLRFTITMSVDGDTAGPEQSLEDPLGKGGEALHEWFFATRSLREMTGEEGGDTGVDDQRTRSWNANIGAHIVGRNMFGPIRGERLFDNLDGGLSGFECVELVSSPAVAHYRYVRAA